MTGDSLLLYLWLPLLVTVVGGLILAGVLAIFVAPVREKFWKPIGRGLRWLTSIRLTTVARQNALRADGRSEVRSEVAAERAAHRPQPVWRIARIDEVSPLFAGKFALAESQGVTVWDAQLSAPAEMFAFIGPNQWLGPLRRRQEFDGQPTAAGRKSGVMFNVRWRESENGDWCEGQAWLERVNAAVVF